MTELPVPRTFDYDQLDRPTQDSLRQHASRLGEMVKNTATNLWEMGKLLAEAQAQLAAAGRGTFLSWLDSETGLNYRTAYRLINVYRAFDFDSLSKTQLGPHVLYTLSEPSAPPAAREEAIDRSQEGETITHAVAREIIDSYKPAPPKPTPPPAPSPEYLAFEREILRPQLHDAQKPNAPQVLTGKQEALLPVPDEQREKAATSIREAVVETVRGIDATDQESLDRCADELLDIMGQASGSIGTSARYGVELARGPRTLSDLTELCIWTCGACMDGMTRDQYLAWRKRSLRLLDAISFANGMVLYEHRLQNGQLVYSLLPPTSSAS